MGKPSANRKRKITYPPESEVELFLQANEMEPEHTRHVADLALQLFDQLSYRHKLGALEREWLRCAALLHDVGWSRTPDGRGHHKHSFRMILDHNWEEIPRSSVLLIALVARYHRKALPQRQHEGYRRLGPAKQRIVKKLAAILRVADALDRGHVQRVKRLHLEDNSPNMIIRVDATSLWKAEQLGVEKKKDLFEQVYGCELQCLPV